MDIILDVSKDAEPPSTQIAQQVADLIKTNELHAGDSLPSIRELAEKLDKSPSTIHRAYTALEEKGFVESFSGKGYCVSSLKGEIETQSTVWRAFFSYARKDDEQSYGAITKLKAAIQNEYALLTGNQLNIFHDKTDIGWGDDWRGIIRDNLGNTVFFIPILTPTYLRRPSCLGELKSAYTLFKERNQIGGIFPILFTNCRTSFDDLSDDQLATYLKGSQWADWSDLQYEDPSSGPYRKEIRNLVNKMIDFDKQYETQPTHQRNNSADSDASEDDTLGYIEQIALLEDGTQTTIEEIQQISSIIEEIGGIFGDHPIDSAMPFSARITVIETITSQLDNPATKLEEHCREYSRIMEEVDLGFHAIVETSNPKFSFSKGVTYDECKSFYETMSNLNDSVKISFSQMHDFCKVLHDTEHFSKNLRKPIRRIRSAIEDFASSEHYYQTWEQAAQKLCDEVRTAESETPTKE